MALNSFIGTTVSIAASEPSALTETGFEAVSGFQEIGQLQMVSETGDTINMIEVPVLKDRRVQRIVGGRDGSTVQLTISYDSSDAGQVILRAGAGTNTVHTLRFDDGFALTTSRWFMTCILADLRYAQRDMTTAYQFTQTLYPQSDIIGPFDSTN